MLNYLNQKSILSCNQFGFLPDKSTHQSPFNVIKHVYSSLNNNKILGCIYLDVAKAFNCIDHKMLYYKMYNAGFSGNVIRWFKSYLGHTQVVKIGNLMSNEVPIPAGIAQGMVLGPLLFIFYINDIVKKLKFCNIISMFADDCVLYISGNNWPSIRNKLQSDLNEFVGWTDRNALRQNTSKTKAMIFGTRGKLMKIKDPTPLCIYGNNLGFVSKYNYLGVLLDSEMTLEPFFKSIIKRVNSRIFGLRKTRKYISFDTSVQIYKQTILPYFDYGGFISISLSKDKKHELQVMQNDIL